MRLLDDAERLKSSDPELSKAVDDIAEAISEITDYPEEYGGELLSTVLLITRDKVAENVFFTARESDLFTVFATFTTKGSFFDGEDSLCVELNDSLELDQVAALYEEVSKMTTVSLILQNSHDISDF